MYRLLFVNYISIKLFLKSKPFCRGNLPNCSGHWSHSGHHLTFRNCIRVLHVVIHLFAPSNCLWFLFRLTCIPLSAPYSNLDLVSTVSNLRLSCCFQEQKLSTSYFFLTWDESPVTTMYLHWGFLHFLIERGLVEGSQ